jgi:hypothetical protein
MRSPQFLLFNAAAALAGVAALVAAAWSTLMPASVAPCAERYHAMTTFGLERGGVVLTAADLQSSLEGKDVGVVDSVSIGPVKGVPAPLAMGVRLQKASVSNDGSTTPFTGGTRFPWQPRAMQGKTSACLSYSVLLPADFDFSRGGVLPGISGAEDKEQGERFAVQFAWRPKDVSKEGGGVTLRVTENGAVRGLPVERAPFELPRGRWVKLEQEVVLNTPKMEDGTLRVWVDGVLTINRRDVAYRSKPQVAIGGVSVEVYRGSGPSDAQAAAGKAATVWLTPFEARWQ